MTLTANSLGQISGKFTIPENIPAGDKLVAFAGQGGSAGVAVFSGQGTVTRQVRQKQTTIRRTRWQSPPPPAPAVRPNLPRSIVGTALGIALRAALQRFVDPLAQTFALDSNDQISGVEVWFTAMPTTSAIVQIRETTVGFPNSTVVAEAVLEPDDILLGGLPTRFNFPAPVMLIGGTEYAIVVMCNDATGEVSVAEMGKFDAVAQRWITAQPYTVGTMLSSSNASTWTPHQDRDLAFRLISPSYTSTTRTIPLGKATVTGATDLMLMSFADVPVSEASVDYTLTLPDASVVTVSDGQPVKLAAAITGDVQIAAQLKGAADFSPVLHPGSQLVSGAISTTADYVTRAIPAGSGVTVKVIFDAEIPSGAGVTVQYSGIDGGDTFLTIPVSSTSALDAPFYEFIHSVSGVNETAVRIKLILTGTAAARPRIQNLRVIVT